MTVLLLHALACAQARLQPGVRQALPQGARLPTLSAGRSSPMQPLM